MTSPGDMKNIPKINKFFHRFREKSNEPSSVHETFQPVPIISQIGMVFKSLNIDNVVSFMHDGNEFYRDYDDKSGDLPAILTNFNTEINRLYGEYLAVIHFIVDAQRQGFRYTIMTSIRKSHPRGASPILIDITGLKEINSDQKNRDEFLFFIDELEMAVRKYMPVNTVTVDHGDEKSIGKIDTADAGSYEKNSGKIPGQAPGKNNTQGLFPLYGVTPGVTTVSELAKLGKHCTMRDDTGKLYKYYVVKGMNIWYVNELSDHIYITYSSPLPDRWRNLGFSWKLSYNQWIELFRKLSWEVEIVREPRKVKHYSGKGNSFEAEITVIAPAAGIDYIMRISFDYGNKTGMGDSGTIYSIGIAAP